jgi:hypothetical protein
MPIAESPLAKHPRSETKGANPTIQMLNLHPNFPLSYLGEMPNGQRGAKFKPLSRLPLATLGYASRSPNPHSGAGGEKPIAHQMKR